MDEYYWSSDVRVSMPVPTTNTKRVPMSGFVMTDGGLAHDIDEATFMRIATPTYSPRDFGLETVREDIDVDTPPSDIEHF